MERRRRLLFRELLPGCDLIMTVSLSQRSSSDAAHLPLALGEKEVGDSHEYQ